VLLGFCDARTIFLRNRLIDNRLKGAPFAYKVTKSKSVPGCTNVEPFANIPYAARNLKFSPRRSGHRNVVQQRASLKDELLHWLSHCQRMKRFSAPWYYRLASV
jgi:hypothetical protein